MPPDREGQREHGANRAAKPQRRLTGAGSKMAVVHDARRDQRVCHLQQDRAGPAEQDHPLSIDSSARPSDAIIAYSG
jgi:hypothetical protein